MEIANDNDQHAQLVTFGKRSPMTSLDRRAPRMGARPYDGPWTTPAYVNGIKDGPPTEHERFLPPVRLDPGFNSLAEYSNAVSQASETSKLIKAMEKSPPPDRFYIVYIIMIIHGIAVLIPWNMFINAKSYFEDYKLDQGNQSSAALKDYQINFMSYVGMASQTPGFIINILNVFLRCCGGGNLGVRVICGIINAVIVLILTVILAMLDTSTWAEEFFWITMGSVLVISMGCALYQNSLYGIVAVLPMKYTNAVVFGTNISGTIVAVVNIAMLVVAPDQKTAAVYYFVAAILILLIAFDAYFLTSHSRFYQHYQNLHELKQKEAAEDNDHDSKDVSIKEMFRTFRRVFGRIWYLLFGVWCTFFTTLLIFPAVMSDVKPMQIGMSGNYWTAIFCFLFFNLFAALGNLMTEFVKWPSAKWINIVIVMRVVFVPLLVLGNFRPDERSLPVYIQHDSVFLASAVLFSFTSGYCSSLVMMYAPKCVPLKDAPTAGMMMALGLCFGIMTGVNASRIWSCVINHC